jgi:hypothetical protein
MKRIATMPGFTADASLCKADTQYATLATGDSSSTIIVPQIPIGLCTKAAYYCNRGIQKWCDIEARVCDTEV